MIIKLIQPYEVIIENENVEKIDFNSPVDLVAITVTQYSQYK